jgi:hypothetical protein
MVWGSRDRLGDRLSGDGWVEPLALSAADVDQLERVAPRQAWAGDRVAVAGRQLAHS